MSKETLTEAMRSLGLSHRKAEGQSQAHVVFVTKTGAEVARCTAHEGWALVHAQREATPVGGVRLSVGDVVCHMCSMAIPAGRSFVIDTVSGKRVARCSTCEGRHNFEGTDNDPSTYDYVVDPDTDTENGFHC